MPQIFEQMGKSKRENIVEHSSAVNSDVYMPQFTTDSSLPLHLIARFQEEICQSSIAIIPVCKTHAKTQGYMSIMTYFFLMCLWVVLGELPCEIRVISSSAPCASPPLLTKTHT